MKNDLAHLTDSLFMVLDGLTDPTDKDGKPLSDDVMRQRIATAGAVTNVSRAILDAGRLAVAAQRAMTDSDTGHGPRLLGLEKTSAEGED